MNILGVSTSSNIATVAICENDKPLLELNLDNNKTHSETFIPLLNELLIKTNLKLSNINAIACDVGPGSFTGIRIGISSVKAISESLKIPLISVSSLEALAYNINGIKCDTICSIIDARNNQIYSGIFDKNYNLIENYIADDINVLINSLKTYKNILYVGDGALCHKQLLGISSFPYENVIHAKNIAKCGYYKYINNIISTPDSIIPFYLRKSQAERMKNKNG